MASLRQQQDELAPLKVQVGQLERERNEATNRLAAVIAENDALKKRPQEVLKLRGEVGQLRQENTAIKSTSALNKITADPATRKLMRDQQKVGMGAAYKTLATRLKLTEEKTDQFNDVLADYVMDNVDLITQVLHDGTAGVEFDRVFDSEEVALQQKIRDLLGPEALAEYQKYSANLINAVSTDQFAAMLTGTQDEKTEKKKQFHQAMQEETAAVRAAAGLPADYQMVPMLNFRNIASEEMGNRSVQLMDDIYARVAARAESFLTPKELESFATFRQKARENSQTALLINRRMMAPLAR